MQSGILFRSNSSPFHILLQNHPWPSNFYLQLPTLSYPTGRTPDSGAGRVRSWNFGTKRHGERVWEAKKRNRRWWSDDGGSDADELAPGFLEEFVDSLWFLKVLRSYGWFSPLIIISSLAASGPKAFLMALSIPFGFNILTFVFKKLWGWVQSNNDYYKPKTTPEMENVTVTVDDEEDEQTTHDESELNENLSSVLNSNGSASFGGWEDLVDERELKARRAKRRIKGRKKKRSVPLKERMRELKMKVEGERELPLLLKFLVAVFPFLSSWTELM